MKVKSVMYEDCHGRLERIHIKYGSISTFATVEITHEHIYFYCFRDFYNAASSLRSMKHGKQYTLPLSSIYDIEIIDVPPVKRAYNGPTSFDELADPENCHTFCLVLRDEPESNVCEVRAHRNSRLHQRITLAWYTHFLRDSTDLHIVTSQYNVSMDFYVETINAINATSVPQELCEVLNDFANEVIMDITLKSICFKSRELFLVLFRLYDDMTTSTPSKLLSHLQTSRKKSTGEDLVMLQQQTLLWRIKVIHSINKLISAVFFCAGCIDHSFDVFDGSATSPLDLLSWFNMLLPDIYKRLCKVCKCDSIDALAIDAKINHSLSGVKFTMSRRPSMNQVTRVFTDDMLTPLRQRIIEQQSFLNDDNPIVAVVCQSVRDLQLIIVQELCMLSVQGRPAYSLYGVMQYPPAMPSCGDILTHQPLWTTFIENVLLRAADIMDDILSMKDVLANLQDRLQRRSRVSALRQERNKKFSVLTNREISIDEEDDLLELSEEYDQWRPRVPPSPHRKPKGNLSLLPGNVFSMQRKIRSLALDILEAEYTAFETQEFLLFTATSLLRTLAYDSSKVRYFIRTEMEPQLYGIVHVFNLLVPRPEQEALAEKAAAAALPSSPLRQPRPSSPIKDTKLSSKEQRLQKLRGESKGLSPADPENGETKGQASPVKALVPNLDSTQTKETPQPAIPLDNSFYPPLSLSSYGPPRYAHLSQNSWELLVMSRRFIEDIVRLLDLNISFVNINTSTDDLYSETELLSRDKPRQRSTSVDAEAPVPMIKLPDHVEKALERRRSSDNKLNPPRDEPVESSPADAFSESVDSYEMSTFGRITKRWNLEKPPDVDPEEDYGRIRSMRKTRQVVLDGDPLLPKRSSSPRLSRKR